MNELEQMKQTDDIRVEIIRKLFKRLQELWEYQDYVLIQWFLMKK